MTHSLIISHQYREQDDKVARAEEMRREIERAMEQQKIQDLEVLIRIYTAVIFHSYFLLSFTTVIFHCYFPLLFSNVIFHCYFPMLFSTLIFHSYFPLLLSNIVTDLCNTCFQTGKKRENQLAQQQIMEAKRAEDQKLKEEEFRRVREEEMKKSQLIQKEAERIRIEKEM